VEQYNAVERNICAPSSDRERRLGEFRAYAAQLGIQRIQVPKGPEIGQFFYCAVYLENDKTEEVQFSPEMLAVGPLPNGAVDGWKDNQRVPFQPTRFALGELRLLVAMGSPPGELTDEFLGFPPGAGNGIAGGAGDRCGPPSTQNRNETP